MTLAEDVLSIEGTLWLVLRGVATTVFALALVAWIGFASRERQRGTIRSWFGAVIVAAGVVALLLLIATLVG